MSKNIFNDDSMMDISLELQDNPSITIEINGFKKTEYRMQFASYVEALLDDGKYVDDYKFKEERQDKSYLYIWGHLDYKEAITLFKRLEEFTWKYYITTIYHKNVLLRTEHTVNWLINPYGNRNFDVQLTIESNKQTLTGTTLDLRMIDVSGLETIDFSALRSQFHVLDITGWNTSKCKRLNFSNTDFKQIIGLDTLDLSSLTTADNMFSGCENLTEVDLSKTDMGNVRNTHAMFYKCFDLSNIKLPASLMNRNLKCMDYMFSGCHELTSIHMRDWDVSGVITA